MMTSQSISKSVTIVQHSVAIMSQFHHESIHAPSCLIVIPWQGLYHTCSANLTTFRAHNQIWVLCQAYVILAWLIPPCSSSQQNMSLISGSTAHVCLCEIYTQLPPSYETSSVNPTIACDGHELNTKWSSWGWVNDGACSHSGLLPAPGFIKQVFIVEFVVHVINKKLYLSTRHRWYWKWLDTDKM